MMKKENPDNKALLNNVVHSTENALLALKHLEQNLIQGRFKEGLESYEAMIQALIGQRIWSSDKYHPKINKNLKEIAATAQNIIDILQPYVKNLNKLTSIDGEIIFESDDSEIAIASIHENSLNSDEEKVIQIVKGSPRKRISFTRLRSELGWEKKKLDQILANSGNGSEELTISQYGSRKMVSLISTC